MLLGIPRDRVPYGWTGGFDAELTREARKKVKAGEKPQAHTVTLERVFSGISGGYLYSQMIASDDTVLARRYRVGYLRNLADSLCWHIADPHHAPAPD